MLSQALWVTGVLFLAALTQSATGFGLALVSMPLLSLRLPLPQATALVATISMAVEIAILWRYWEHLRWGPVVRLVLASLVGVPVGVTLLRRWPERWLLAGLGVVLAGYALYALLGWRLPRLRARFWPWLMGFLAGALGGAYNTSGPPVILYGHAREWPPAEFKANLQAFFLSSSTAVFFAHLLAGHIGPTTWLRAVWAAPGMAFGLWLGGRLDVYLSPERFRRLVLVALFLLGARMLWAALGPG